MKTETEAGNETGFIEMELIQRNTITMKRNILTALAILGFVLNVSAQENFTVKLMSTVIRIKDEF